MLPDGDISMGTGACPNMGANHSRGHAMSLMIHFLHGLFGFAALSSFAGFVFHLFSGNPDMALICFVGIGGSAAVGWMISNIRNS
jgi:hypothetical protein